MNRFVLKSAVTVVVTAMLVGAGAVGAVAAQPQDDVLGMINQQRASAGRAALVSDGKLDAAAQEWAQSMSSAGTMVHSTNDWRSARIPAGWDTNGENIAYGYTSAGTVMTAWMASEGHRANILRPNYTRVGVGYVANGNYWVQIFAGYPLDRDGVYTSGVKAVDAAYAAMGGETGSLGKPTSGVLTLKQNGSGVARSYQNGSIYWTPATGAHAVSASYRDFYFSVSGADGPLAYPTTDLIPMPQRAGGGAQAFQLGSLYSSDATGVHSVVGAMRGAYFALGGALGALGWPTAEAETVATKGGGTVQAFESGGIFRSGAGTYAVTQPVRAAFANAGDIAVLGWPSSVLMTLSQNGGGTAQAFTDGSIYQGTGLVPFAVSGAIRSHYFALGGAAGALGWPTGSQECATVGTCSQAFQGGTIYYSAPVGTWVGDPRIEKLYASSSATLGSRASGLLPVSQNGGGVAQAFANGSVYAGNGLDAYALTGEIRSRYWAAGGSAGSLGWPTSAQSCTSATACSQSFQYGTIFWTRADGARVGDARIEKLYASTGGAAGSLGAVASEIIPIPQATGGGIAQIFANASVYAEKGRDAFAVSGAIRQYYWSLGGAGGAIGWPTSAQTCLSDGTCSQDFWTASIFWSKTEGARLGDRAIEKVHAQSGGVTGALGARASELIFFTPNGGTAQGFARGSVYHGPYLDAYSVTGKVRDYYWSAGGSTGTFGWPTSAASCTSAGVCTQSFQNGTITR